MRLRLDALFNTLRYRPVVDPKLLEEQIKLGFQQTEVFEADRWLIQGDLEFLFGIDGALQQVGIPGYHRAIITV